MSIGMSPVSRDSELMENNALEQAAVIYTRLESVYSIDKQLGLEMADDTEGQSASASVKYTVSADMILLKDNYTLLINNSEQKIGAYYIAIYSKKDNPCTLKFLKTKTQNIPDTLYIKTDKETIYSYGKAVSSRLDDAFDEAFNNAVLEYSKYYSANLKSLFKEYNQKSSHAYELSAVNRLSKLELSTIEFEIRKEDNTYISYRVKIELKKRINNEDNCGYPGALRFLPFGG
jgi:hypothetical protein